VKRKRDTGRNVGSPDVIYYFQPVHEDEVHKDELRRRERETLIGQMKELKHAWKELWKELAHLSNTPWFWLWLLGLILIWVCL
jgi:hypothetical protein